MSAVVEVFDPIPSWGHQGEVLVMERPAGGLAAPAEYEVLGVPVALGQVPAELGLTAAILRAAGFEGKIGQTMACGGPDGRPAMLYGIGDPHEADATVLREAAGAFAGAVPWLGRLAMILPDRADEAAAQAAVEGVMLARYRYGTLKREESSVPVAALTLLSAPGAVDTVTRGARRGASFARATALARDLANSPPSMLTAARMAECATVVGAKSGLGVEIFEHDELVALGCGGLLGVNAGSADPPRMIKLRYVPAPGVSGGRLTLVGKGIMYDSGGISLKPSDAVHATMKNDMSGAGAILAAMAVLPELGCPTAVTGYLMCTDNMPSGTATKLGDVLTIYGGTTVEVINTDAEGRLVLADALVLATEEPTDAIVDIATLTGASMRALGAEIAGVFGNDQSLVDQVLACARSTDEPAWQLPLDGRYRHEIDSDIADLKNMGGPNGGAIHAALFLKEFVGALPWAHIDIAGPAQNDVATAWRPRGCTGFGARLLAELALTFTRP